MLHCQKEEMYNLFIAQKAGNGLASLVTSVLFVGQGAPSGPVTGPELLNSLSDLCAICRAKPHLPLTPYKQEGDG